MKTMWLLRRVVVCLAGCFVVTTSLNLLMAGRLRSNLFPEHHHRQRTEPKYIRGQEKVYLQGEIYAVREMADPWKYQKNRTGLRMLSSVYKHLPAVRAQYSSISPRLIEFIKKLKKDITTRRVTDDPWDLARKWAHPRSLIPESAPGLGDILAALSTAPIKAADVGYKGTQLKASLKLQGGQVVVFKPKRFPREEIVLGAYGGFDRHNGEIAGFHLSRVLGLRMAPLSVGRNVSLKKQILPVSTKRLSKTFFQGKGGKMCFYGECMYCKRNESVCDESQFVEGTIILWLPRSLKLREASSPWRRTYRNNLFAKWETNENYCESVVNSPHAPRLLHLIDAAVFDFIIQNGDRHNYAQVDGEKDHPVVLLDNGKSFGDPYVDHMDILAPLLQCCRIHQSMYERLILLSGGGLSMAMKELLDLDPIAPILTQPHLLAMDRRVLHVLAALSYCQEEKGGWHNVLY